MVAEPAPANRSEFQRDRDRVLHCSAFRRLALKTQVFTAEEGDHHRTRLTHSLEVAQIARSLARALGFDEDLTEALALAHDLGHTPFGHTGEDALNAALQPWGGFDHNLQTLRIVADLERRYLDFDGLNLTRDMLEGLAKRSGPVRDPSALLRDYDRRLGLELDTFMSGEGQLAAIADDIAYNAHDLEDALRAGLIALDEADAVPLVRDLKRALVVGHEPVDPVRLPFALSRALVDAFVRDALRETGRRLAEADLPDAEALRRFGAPIAGLSAEFAAASCDLKHFLFTRVYRHPRLVEVRTWAATIVSDLATRFLAEPDLLPQHWGKRLARQDETGTLARHVADYIAGMTDRYAIREHRRLFDDTPGFR